MKKLLFSLSLLASLATFATESTIDASAQIYGVLPVTVAANTKSVIVSVPWVASSTATDAAISVSNLIRTANLTDNDQVKVWNKNSQVWNVWTLSGGIWNPVDTVLGGDIVKGSGADETTLARGTALILTRATTPTTAWTFYLNGQYTSTTASGVTCVLPTGEATKAYTLLAPPNTTATTVNSFTWTWDNVGENDYITIPAGRLVCHNGEWGAWGLNANGSRTWRKSTHSITAGTGFWYTSTDTNKTAKAVSVAW